MDIELSDSTLERLAEIIAKPVIPTEIDMWSSTEVAAYLKVSKRQVTRQIVHKNGFPAPICLGDRSQRWKAIEVIRWTERQR